MKKLTLVVNCTGRKSVQPTPELQVRDLPDLDDAARFDMWSARVQNAVPSCELRNLYQGEAWLQSMALANDALDAGFDVELLVASAGLGLRDGSSRGPAYSATFAPGHVDTVAAGTAGVRTWWTKLARFDAAISLAAETADSVLMVLSHNYANAMEDDLVALANRGGDLLLIGGAREIDGLPRIACDRALRSELGGTVSGLNARIARAWFGRRTAVNLYDVDDARRWNDWTDSVRVVETFDRVPGDDDAILAHIRSLVAVDPTLSATRALRALRDSGVACEQKRFGELFRDAIRG